jgi:hypothetical protein
MPTASERVPPTSNGSDQAIGKGDLLIEVKLGRSVVSRHVVHLLVQPQELFLPIHIAWPPVKQDVNMLF